MAGQIIPLYPDSGTDAARVQGIPVSVVDPTTGQILQYDLATRQYVPVDYVGKAGGTFTGNLTLNGTANTAPNQTAASGSSLMTRDLVDARAMGPVLWARATADVAKTNDAVLANDSQLVLTLTAGTWLVETWFRIGGGVNGSQMRVNVANGPGSENILVGTGTAGQLGLGAASVQSAVFNTTLTSASGSVAGYWRVILPTPSNAPTISLQWAQNTSGAAAATRLANSFIMATRLGS